MLHDFEFEAATYRRNALMKMAIQRLGLGARGYGRILKVARTVADLADASELRPEHISEASPFL